MKKNNNRFLPNFKFAFVLFAGLCFLLLTSCDFEDVSGPEPEPEPEPQPPADTLGTVAPDGILETVTWNLEWYGSFGNGPSDEDLQTNNALDVIDSLKADLYALQEITDQTALENLTSRMKGYRGFVADYINYNQKTAFIFNTQTIDSLSSGPITQNQNEYNWAGRFPLYFSFNYSYQDVQIPVYAVVIHSKCCTDQESYQRRMQAAESLHTYLTRNKPDANIVFLGDYNDDVDESIREGSETPYISFVQDSDDFLVLTKSLSDEGQSTTVNYPDAVDHITISNEMERYYELGSEMVFDPTDSFIDNYGSTTSDHYPVIAKFDIRQ